MRLAEISDQSKWQATYGAACYRVYLPHGTQDVRIGQPCSVPAGMQPWAILTACNPQSRLLPDDENANRQAALLALVGNGGWASYQGENLSDSGNWPIEASVLVQGISLTDAVRLGKTFAQAALVYCEAGGLPALIWLD